MKKLSDIILISDLDGTLVEPGAHIIPANQVAVERFVKKGGKFAIATGRSMDWTRNIASLTKVNFPSIMYNGGVIYDFKKEEYLLQRFLPDSYKELVKLIANKFPNIPILPITEEKYFEQNDEISLCDYAAGKREDFSFSIDWQNNNHPCYKVLFGLPNGIYDIFFDFINSLEQSEVRFIGSANTLGEMLPLNTSKGHALKFLVENNGVEQKNIVAVGDYYNDLEMIKYASIGATLETSPYDMKSAANLVLRSCEQGAVAELIEYLENKFDN